MESDEYWSPRSLLTCVLCNLGVNGNQVRLCNWQEIRGWRRLGGQSLPGCNLLSHLSHHSFVLESQKNYLHCFSWFGGLEFLSLLPTLPVAGAEQRQAPHLNPHLSFWVLWGKVTYTVHIYKAPLCTRARALAIQKMKQIVSTSRSSLAWELGISSASSKPLTLALRK